MEPNPNRSGPGPLAPQAKPEPVRPRTLGPPSQTQAGPAQDPWPPSQKPFTFVEKCYPLTIVAGRTLALMHVAEQRANVFGFV